MPAAVPKFVGDKFDTAPPGHRFRLYYEGWWTKEVDNRRIKTLDQELAGRVTPGRRTNLERRREAIEMRLEQTPNFAKRDDEENLEQLKNLVACGETWTDTARMLRERQRSAAEKLCAENCAKWTVTTTSPTAIGTGVEHPIENGLLFYDPHGLPYLPGSSLKGGLRRAAEDLALFSEDSRGWTLGLVWYFFGFDGAASFLRSGDGERKWRDAYQAHLERVGDETFAWLEQIPAVRDRLQREPARDLGTFLRQLRDDGKEGRRDCDALRTRGALDCWDAFFVPPRLRVDIMNPHLGGYYQGDETPHETDSPTPIYFLAIDATVEFDVVVAYRSYRDDHARPPVSDWQALVRAALQHLGAHLGIGAKTSVGYGRFCFATTPRTAETSGPSAPTSRPTPRAAPEPSTEVWDCTVALDPGKQQLTAQGQAGKAFGDHRVLEAAPERLRAQLKKSKSCRALVTVRIDGNKRTIEKLEEKA